METVVRRVLVVDDHATDRLKLSMAIKRLGHRVEAAAAGPEALEMMGESQFDLVLLDLLMPEMDGFQVLETIKADRRLQGIPVVVVSSLDDRESIDRAATLGAAGHMRRVSNPYDYDFLMPTRSWNTFITISAFFLFSVQIIFVVNFFWSIFKGKKAGPNPWNANTLEWVAPSPPPHGNFPKPPVVHRGPYEYASPDVEDDFYPQDQAPA